MGFPAFPTRQLTAEELKRYDEDGVIMVTGALDKNWVEMVEQGVEEARHAQSVTG
ncbi:phytanoyl-CoA dioxygenase, partial [Tenacibaculum discolor]